MDKGKNIMEITINHELLKNEHNKLTGTWCNDINGNVFLNINENYYLLSIDNDNNLEFFGFDKEQFYILPDNMKIKYEHLIETADEPLKKKILDEVEIIEESDDDEETILEKNNMKLLKEDAYYIKDEKNNVNDDLHDVDLHLNYDDTEFSFYVKNKKCFNFLQYTLSTPSIYDTYFRDKNKNVSSSIECEERNSYRISIYEDSTLLELNIIGDRIKKFYIVYNINDSFEYEIKCIAASYPVKNTN
ncbi:hypothetical protein BMW23_0871 [Bodo saltans virus]|uniref:Uncharacterized protein n=1 Tax=Bodo saltans virus TaxID=2024608 RepID=A0A2H4UVN2_9VIRU|nr:hypothetical protein QJ851_gp0853 [Bodo saltans virus]ATZ80916.1 hypothetical protein BMW23_0871 [Bodo saltans virus]